VRNDGTVIEVRYVDLEGSDRAILGEIGRPALVIERMAAAEGPSNTLQPAAG